jgi:hypothetical protein
MIYLAGSHILRSWPGIRLRLRICSRGQLFFYQEGINYGKRRCLALSFCERKNKILRVEEIFLEFLKALLDQSCM